MQKSFQCGEKLLIYITFNTPVRVFKSWNTSDDIVFMKKIFL